MIELISLSELGNVCCLFGTISRNIALILAPSDRWGLSEASMPLVRMER